MKGIRDNAHVQATAQRLGIGYDDALALVRSQASDPLAVAAAREIDAAVVAGRARASALFADMAGRTGLEPAAIASLVEKLAADAELETWIMRRVNLTRANGAAPAIDEHPENE